MMNEIGNMGKAAGVPDIGFGIDWLFQQFVLGYVADELSIVLHIHFFQNAGAVSTDGFCA